MLVVKAPMTTHDHVVDHQWSGGVSWLGTEFECQKMLFLRKKRLKMVLVLVQTAMLVTTDDHVIGQKWSVPKLTCIE